MKAALRQTGACIAPKVANQRGVRLNPVGFAIRRSTEGTSFV